MGIIDVQSKILICGDLFCTKWNKFLFQTLIYLYIYTSVEVNVKPSKNF